MNIQMYASSLSIIESVLNLSERDPFYKGTLGHETSFPKPFAKILQHEVMVITTFVIKNETLSKNLLFIP